MLRLILLVLIAILLWRLLRPLFRGFFDTHAGTSTSKRRRIDQIEDAEFEDITDDNSKDKKQD